VAGFWRRIFGTTTDKTAEKPAVPPAAATPEAPPTDTAWLEALAARLARGETMGSPLEPMTRLAALEGQGHGRLAAELAAKLAFLVPPGSVRQGFASRAAALFLDAGDSAAALPHLETLAEDPAHAARAHFLLGEHYRREGDTREALRHFEATLAADVDYPNARVRAQALRASLGRAAPGPPVAAPTLLGPEAAPALAARYQLVRELGRGASGAVYLARDNELDREVAIKLLHAHLARAGGQGIARFFAEARVAASLRHPGIIAILDLDERHLRIVMELARGGTLQARLSRGALDAGDALERHVELLGALRAAHRREVVHRDLKPANLLYREPDGELVIGDFGVAHLGGAVPASAAEAVGTLHYMPPEQRRGEVDPRSDLFAAGAILHETLTGRPPWDPHAALRGAIDPAALRPDIALPAPLAEKVVAHLRSLLAPDPRGRPPTDEALAEAQGLADAALVVTSSR
jgi:serine/threonine-protein kinase